MRRVAQVTTCEAIAIHFLRIKGDLEAMMKTVARGHKAGFNPRSPLPRVTTRRT